MKLYKILTAIPLIFAISLSTQAESFKLLSIKMAKPDPSFPPAKLSLKSKHVFFSELV